MRPLPSFSFLDNSLPSHFQGWSGMKRNLLWSSLSCHFFFFEQWDSKGKNRVLCKKSPLLLSSPQGYHSAFIAHFCVFELASELLLTQKTNTLQSKFASSEFHRARYWIFFPSFLPSLKFCFGFVFSPFSWDTLLPSVTSKPTVTSEMLSL